MSSMRIKVQFGEEKSSGYQRKNPNPLKFVYVVESSNSKTIDELRRALQQYIFEQLSSNSHVEIVQLTTDDGFVLSNFDICAKVLKDNDRIICIDMGKFAQENYPTLDLQQPWLTIKQHDASDNREKTIQVGISNLGKLYLRMYGTQNLFGLHLFTAFELLTIAKEKRRDTIIARLDNSDDSEEASSSVSWFLEAKWEYDSVSGTILFIICSLKTGSNNQVWSEKLGILLDESRMRIQKGQLTHLSGEEEDSSVLNEQQRARLKELASTLPPPKRTGPEISTIAVQSQKPSKYECEGESAIRMVYGNTNTVIANQDYHFISEGTFRQNFFITQIIFSKKPLVLPEILQQKRSTPVEKPISIARLAIFYQAHDGSWRDCQDVAIAPATNRNEEPQWLPDTVLNIEPDKLVPLAIRGAIMVKGQPGADNPARRRMHKSLPQPLKLKVVVTDSMGKQCSLIVEQLNKPLELETRESFLKNNQSSIAELLAFVYADDCDGDERIYMTIYLDKEQHFVARMGGSSYVTYERKSMRTMEFNAKQNGTPEVFLDSASRKSGDQELKATALFDLETYMFYAIRLEITTKTSKTEETILLPLEKIK